MTHLPKPIDTAVFIFAVVLLTWHPYFAHGQLNLFESGLYLPGIDAIRHHQVPYRDFFYLRGPFELYMPALLMSIWGEHAWVLNLYFYAGTVLAFIIAILIAVEVVADRFLLYCFVPVFVARLFPRVVFTFWGGMRFAIGLLGVYCLVRFLKAGGKSAVWIFWAGFLTVVGMLTSVEIGVCLALACTAAVALNAGLAAGQQRWRVFWGNVFWCKMGALIVLVPYGIYLYAVGALGPFLDSMWTVLTRMNVVFVQTEVVPDTWLKFFTALTNPGNKNFRQMTPVFCLLFFAVYFWRRWQKKTVDWRDAAAFAVAVYGLVIYAGAFRNLWASQFEMALMPLKIILFFLLARGIEALRANTRFLAYRPWLIGIVLAIVFGTSIPFALSRLQKRFFVGQYAAAWVKDKDPRTVIPLKGEGEEIKDVPRLEGSFIPAAQAKDIMLVNAFLKTNTAANEKIFMYPELGAMHFITARPWVGRFPTVTLAWLKDDWHRELMRDLTLTPPRFAVLNQQLPDYFQAAYFPVKANVQKNQEIMDFIHAHYLVAAQTPTYTIYRFKSK